MAKTYGPLMLLHFGSVSILVASSADAAREIMKTHDLIFANRVKLKIAHIIFYDCQDIAFSQYGESGGKLKSIAVLNLLNNKRVQSYRHVREEEMAFMIEKIQKAEKSLLNLSELVISLTNNVICRVALGRRYDGRDFKNLLQRTLELLGCFSVGSYIPWLSWVDRLTGLEEKAYAIAKEFDELLEFVIDEHLNKKGASGECQDIVDVLVEIQRDDKTDFRLEKDMIKAIILVTSLSFLIPNLLYIYMCVCVCVYKLCLHEFMII
ncbi:hypothetical protein M8C21_023705 [Ambrosia artemisiifolia]|uniref:Uncharacterized protein n=1 Tax=Ambrosia artemisiifolia TaxID=4212 RepID=A0AAD5C7P9_AMBAR|nr:hypothetical protein M8C21_023705 [Ambrosia artemisiifolia]